MVETPVLYITFARPEYASQSFAAIKKSQPRKLYFYSNKARSDRPDEVKRNQEIRSYVEQIDWDCEVKTWFRDEYVDVFTSLWGAIDWVFDNEEKAIIIEEDVVASLAFFSYIDQIIDKYKDNPKVWIISGNNAAPQYSPKGLSYFPSAFVDIYGWASWRHIWKSIDRKLTYWPYYRRTNELKKYYNSSLISWIMKNKGDNLYKKIKGDYNPWDMVFNNNRHRANAFGLIPFVNLSQDIGIIGENHLIKQTSPLSVCNYKSSTFIVENEPDQIVATSYDKKLFFHVILFNTIKRKFKRFLNFS